MQNCPLLSSIALRRAALEHHPDNFRIIRPPQYRTHPNLSSPLAPKLELHRCPKLASGREEERKRKKLDCNPVACLAFSQPPDSLSLTDSLSLSLQFLNPTFGPLTCCCAKRGRVIEVETVFQTVCVCVFVAFLFSFGLLVCPLGRSLVHLAEEEEHVFVQ